jgi:hypothetical protein
VFGDDEVVGDGDGAVGAFGDGARHVGDWAGEVAGGPDAGEAGQAEGVGDEVAGRGGGQAESVED